MLWSLSPISLYSAEFPIRNEPLLISSAGLYDSAAQFRVFDFAGYCLGPKEGNSFPFTDGHITPIDHFDCRFVKSKRRIVSPNFNFLGQLLDYEKELKLQSPSTLSAGNKRKFIGECETLDFALVVRIWLNISFTG